MPSCEEDAGHVRYFAARCCSDGASSCGGTSWFFFELSDGLCMCLRACLCVVTDTSAHDFDIIGAYEMCMEPSKFTPDNLYRRSCHSDSEDPAVENDCAAGCHRGSYDSDGGKRYYCGCEASSANDCAAKNPGEEHATALGC